MILRNRAGENRHCSPSQVMEQIVVFKRVIVPVHSRSRLSVKLTVSAELERSHVSALWQRLQRLPSVLGGIGNNGCVG